jgi:probable rRNA maturation factor
MADTPRDSAHVILVGGAGATYSLSAEAERVLPLALDRLVSMGMAPGVCEVSVTLVDDESIRELNRHYRGKDVATDVLSFSQLDGDRLSLGDMPEGSPVPIGDIVISMPRVAEQAVEYGHSEAREFGYLMVHGLLHLVGFDHETPEDAITMRAAEEDVLAAADLTRETGPG